MLAGLLLVACGSAQAPEPLPEPQKLTTAADMSAPPDLAKDPGVAPACRSCSQSELADALLTHRGGATPAAMALADFSGDVDHMADAVLAHYARHFRRRGS